MYLSIKGSRSGVSTTGSIKIGFIAPLTGDAAAYGEPGRNMTQMAVEEINKNGGINGRMIEVIYEDGKCAGSEAVAAYQKLTNIDGVKFIFGGMCSSETLAIAPLTKDGSTLVVSSLSSNPALEGASPYTFTFSYSDDVMGKTLAKEMSKYERVALITEQTDWNIGIQKVLLDELKANYPKVTVVANEVFPKGATDIRSTLEKVKKMAPAALFLNPAPGVTAETLVKQMAELKEWTGCTMFGQTSYIGESNLKVAPEITEGMIVVDAPKSTNSEFVTLSGEIETAKGTISDLGAYYSAAIIDSTRIMTKLISEFGNDPIAVQKALKERTFSGFISNDINFKNSSFPNIGGGIYKVIDGKAVYQQ